MINNNKDNLSDIHEQFVDDLLVGQQKNKKQLRKMSIIFLIVLSILIGIGVITY